MALRLGVAAEEEQANLLDRIDIAAALIDGSGRVLRSNGKFEGLLGSGLHLYRGRLSAERTDAQAALDRMIQAAIHRNDIQGLSPIALPRRACHLPLIVEAMPTVGLANDVFRFARAVLIVTDLAQQREADVAVLKSVFGLTPAEARPTARIASGMSVEEAAGALGISPGTARAHLKAIFSKTGTHRQSALVELVARLPRTRVPVDGGA
jgi:DNA-binding CsgD family transcriptional regulator